jgi:hypothetical protein
MTLPHLASQAVRYDPQQRTLHALDWMGQPVQYQTPAELCQALDDRACYAASAVIAGGIWLCRDHGVAPDCLPLTNQPALVRDLGQSDNLAVALPQCLQRLDRAHEKTARLATAMCSDDDVLTIYDSDGLFARYLQRMLRRERDMPQLSLIITNDAWPLDPTTTVALLSGAVDASGNGDASLAPYIDILAAANLPHYLVAPHGPTLTHGAIAAIDMPAIITARGIYRPEKISNYTRDTDIGGDIIAFG